MGVVSIRKNKLMYFFFLAQIEEKINLPAQMSGEKREGSQTAKSEFFKWFFGDSLFAVETQIRAVMEGALKVWEVFQ